MNCTHCAHYRAVEDGETVLDFGECRFNPPQVMQTEEGPLTAWPIVDEDGSCSQFRGKQ